MTLGPTRGINTAMPFCPQCRSEFRPGFAVCKACGDVPLVEELPEITELSPDSVDSAVPVGIASDPDIARLAEVDGHTVDLLRVFPLKRTQELQADLSEVGFASLIVPVPFTFPDMLPRFELRVLPEHRIPAEDALRERWAETLAAEGLDDAHEATSVDECPACGATIPLDVDTCPECGLFVGAAAEEDEAEAP